MRKRERAKRSSRRQRGVNIGTSRPVVSVNVRVHEVPSSTGPGGPGMPLGALLRAAEQNAAQGRAQTLREDGGVHRQIRERRTRPLHA